MAKGRKWFKNNSMLTEIENISTEELLSLENEQEIISSEAEKNQEMQATPLVKINHGKEHATKSSPQLSVEDAAKNQKEAETKTEERAKEESDLKQILAHKDQNIETLSHYLNELLVEKDKKQHQVNQEKQQQTERINALTKEVNQLKTEKQQLSDAKGTKNQDELVEQLEVELKELIKENHSLQEENEKLKHTVKTSDSQEAKVNELSTKQEQLEQSMKNMLQEKEKLVKELAMTTQEKDRLAEKLSSTIKEKKSLMKELEAQQEVGQAFDQKQEALELEKNELLESINEANKKIEHLSQTLTQEKEQTQLLQTRLAEKERKLAEQVNETTIASEEIATNEYQKLQEKLAQVEKDKAELQRENEDFQAEIGEVLVFARRKANRTMEEAKIESERMIRTAEMRVEAIHDRAKEILFDVDETKDSVTSLFEDLHLKIQQLSDKKLLFDDFE